MQKVLNGQLNAPTQQPSPLRQAWHWWCALDQNPIYRRERGDWGRPNPYYNYLARFSPFIVLGTLLAGACTAWLNPLFLSQVNEAFLVSCLLCLPGILLNVLTWYGVIMAPALTAPTISLEINAGTWDVIRTTPHTDLSIVLAKFLGAMSRLRIWPTLTALSLLQGVILFISTLIVTNNVDAPPLRLVASLLIGASSALRPWLEVMFAGILGMYLSTQIPSTSLALAASYGGLLFVRLFNNSLLWGALSGVLTDQGSFSYALALTAPPLIYLFINIGLGAALMRRARNLATA